MAAGPGDKWCRTCPDGCAVGEKGRSGLDDRRGRFGMTQEPSTQSTLRRNGFTPIVIVAYISALLGGLLGLILALILRNKPEPEVRRHVVPIAIISAVMMIAWFSVAA